MSGRKISDHSFFAGGMSKDSVLPKGVHTKHYDSVEGDGMLGMYEDTSESISSQQKMSVSKMKSNKQPSYHRN